LGLVVALIGGAPRGAQGQVQATIVGPGERTFPIAVSPLKDLGGGGTLPTEFADLIGRDLALSGLFRVIPREAYIESPDTSGVTEDTVNFADWSVIGAPALVKGTVVREGDQLTVEARLFDVYQRRQLAGRRYRGGLGDFRRMVHKFADEIMGQLTGERGPFDSRIAFLSTRAGRFKDLYVMSLDGEDVQRLTQTETLNVAPSWAPDNRSLLLTSYRGGLRLFSLDVRNGRADPVAAAAGTILGGRWSPDRSRLAVTREQDGNSDIYLLSPDGGDDRRLTDHWGIDVSPTWSPDGSHIAFCSNRGGTPQIYVVEAGGGAARRVTFEGSYNTSPNWSPKGDRLAYTSRVGSRFQIFTVRLDGTDVRQVTASAGDSEDPSWSPDGRYLVFSSTRSGIARLYVADASGRSQVELTPDGGGDTSPAWSTWLD
jgi:TolB protein